jgi:hypothetical protein
LAEYTFQFFHMIYSIASFSSICMFYFECFHDGNRCAEL